VLGSGGLITQAAFAAIGAKVIPITTAAARQYPMRPPMSDTKKAATGFCAPQSPLVFYHLDGHRLPSLYRALSMPVQLAFANRDCDAE